MNTPFSLTKGNAILVSFGITTFLFIATVGAGVLINNSLKEAGRIENSRKAFYSAEGGIEEALYAAAHHASGWLRTSDPDFNDLAFPNNAISNWSANGRKGIQSGRKVWDRPGNNPIIFSPAQEDTNNDFDLGNWREVEMGKEVSFDLFVDESDYKKDSSYRKAAFLPKGSQGITLFPSAFAGSTPEGNIIGDTTQEVGEIVEFSLDLGVGGGDYEINWGDSSPRESFAVSGNYSHIYQGEGDFPVSIEEVGGNTSFPIETVHIVQDILPFEDVVDNFAAEISASFSNIHPLISEEVIIVVPPLPAGVTSAKISWGDGNEDILPLSGGSPHHMYSDLGQKQISLVVQKPGGGQYSSKILDIIAENPGLPFDIAFSSGKQAVFSLEANQIDVSNMTTIPPGTSFQIDWGDQQQDITSNITLTHVYGSEGAYSVWVLKDGSPYYFVGIAEQYHRTGQEFGDQISQIMLDHVSLPNVSPLLSHQSEARVLFSSGLAIPNGVSVNDMRIVWGDGVSTVISHSGAAEDHLYDAVGVYPIQIAFTLEYEGDSFPFSLDVGSIAVQKTPVCTTSGNATGNTIFQTKRAENMTDFTNFMTKGLEGECPTVFFGGAASVTENANINILPDLSTSSLPVIEWHLEGSPPSWLLDLFESTGGSISGQVPDGASEGSSPLFFVAEVEMGGENGTLVSPSFSLDITRVNDAPTMDYTGTFVLSEYVHEPFSISGISFDEYFSDADMDTLTYSFRQDDASVWDQLNIDFISGEIQGKVNTTGTHVFWIKATDPDGESSPELEVQIVAEDRPVLTPRGVKNIFQIDASDVKTLFSDHGANSPVKGVFFDLFLPYDSLPSDLDPDQILLSWGMEAATDLGSISAYSVARCQREVASVFVATTEEDGVICFSHFLSSGFNSGDIYEKHTSSGEGIFVRIKNPLGVFVLENGERKIESLLHILQRESTTGDIFPEPLFPRLTVQIGKEQEWDDGFGDITYLKKVYIRMGIEIDPTVSAGMNLQNIPLPDEDISIESIGSAGGFEQKLQVDIGPRRIAPMFEYAVFQE